MLRYLAMEAPKLYHCCTEMLYISVGTVELCLCIGLELPQSWHS